MSDVRPEVNQVYRERAAHLLAALVRHLGPARMELAEEVLHDAFLRALEVWPWRGVPDNAAGWLFTVARRRALDLLRREARGPIPAGEGCNPAALDDPSAGVERDGLVVDDQLRLIFICCHPSLSRRSAITLTLKTVGGFGVTEIARVFLAGESAVAQQLVRVKRTIASLNLPFELPPEAELQQRRGRVLDVLYLILTEGYASTGGDLLVREDLCRTALRLSRLVAESSVTAGPEADALVALCCLQTSRLAARVGDGALRLLPDQDRARWDHALIAEGMAALVRSARGGAETALHLEAALAARHVAVAPGGTPDWGGIVELYDRLMLRKPTAIVRLNRAIAVAERDGARAGLAELESLRDHPAMQRHVPFHATMAELHGRLGNDDEAARALRRALRLDPNPVERRHLETRLAGRGGSASRSSSGGAR